MALWNNKQEQMPSADAGPIPGRFTDLPPRREDVPPPGPPLRREEVAHGTQANDLLLGPGAEFDGKLTFRGTLRIDAKFTGSIVTDDVLIVGEHARMDAEITCGTIVIHGEVNGNVRASAGVELGSWSSAARSCRGWSSWATSWPSPSSGHRLSSPPVGNQHELRQLEPFLVRWGAAIPVRPGRWAALVEQTAALHDPPGVSDGRTCYHLRGYYMSLQRSDGSLAFPNLDADEARIDRPGEFLCIQSGAKMRCPSFPPPPPPRTPLERLFQGFLRHVHQRMNGGYKGFVNLLESLAPHLEDALLYVADEEDFVDRLAFSRGRLERTCVHSGYWCSLDNWPDTKLDDVPE
jgi:hypothetical protein